MKREKKAVEAKSELSKFLEAVLKHVPAEDDKIYKIPVLNTYIELKGAVINETHTIIMGGAVLPDDTPEVQYVRKFKALQVKIKDLVVKYYLSKKKPGSLREILDMCEIFIAVKNKRVNEDTVKLARKYFDLPPIVFENPNDLTN